MTGIICAMEIELEKILLVTENKEETVISGKKYIKGSICGKNIVASVSGVGKVNAAICAQSMILRFSPNIIINSGVAGGDHADNLAVERGVERFAIDTVEIKCDKKITDALCRSVKKLGIHYETGTIASGDQFINGGEKVKYIKTVFHASATEMEGAAIGQVCALNNVPFCVLRSISDKADSVSHIDNQTFEKIASENSAGAIIGFIEDYAQ